ncbi:MAG: hypothetical protein PF570_04410 [Candidatus Cloacimonetes bacterium]|jgi:hypothetical protein|nr:hypothetical protein [Candidatus Cloacimonadota bacterium]
MMRSILVLIMVTAVLTLSAVTQDVPVKEKNITLEFENIHIKDIEFISGNKIEIEHAKNADVTIVKEKQKVIIKADKTAKIDLFLPSEKIYTLMEDGGKIEFNENRVTIIEGENKVVEFRDGGLFVTDNDETVEISADGIIVNSDDEHVEISSRGIIVEAPDESQHITGFWGQLLGGAINFITKYSIGWIGNNPGFIVKHIINDDDYAGGVNMNFNLSDGDKITKEFHETFNPKRGCKLNVHNRNGKVEIKSWKEDYIDISAILETNKSEDEFEKIKIEVLDEDGCTIKTKELKKNPKVSVNYEIKVPEGVKVSEINSSNGKILIIDCEGDMNLNTSNGKIEVFDSNGKFIAKSSNGGIEFVNLSGIAEAITSNGAIRVVRTPEFKKGVTSNGKITIEIEEKMKNDIYLSTSNGSINISIDPTLDLNIDASTSNSRIDLNGIEVTSSKFSKNSLIGKINKGGTKITASTSNGNIKFYKLEK